jgi:predicted phage terminase large subunit-like protein
MSAEPAPAGTPVSPDIMAFWDYFQIFVEACHVSLPLKDEHREICDVYQAAVLGELSGYEYFLTSMPRRTGKTKILEALSSWTFGEFPPAQMLYGCYSEKLVARSILFSGGVMAKPWYQDIYGDLIHSASKQTVTTPAGGVLYGAGIGATIAGYGGGLKEPAGGYIALDDPANPEAALSKVEAENTTENFELTWKGCRNSDQFCPIFVNAQRIGMNDLQAYIEANYSDVTYKLRFPCVVGGFSRFPETWTASKLLALQRTRIGRYVYASQHQQIPVALGGNLIPVDEFMRWDPAEAETMRWEKLVITVDTALKTKEANDFSCAQLWGRLNKRAYLIDQLHGKWESPELVANVKSFWDKWQGREHWPRPRLIIEEKAAGSPLLQTLRGLGVPCQGIERDIDKARRVQNVLPFIEIHMVYVPKDGSTPWIAGFLQECAEFRQDGTHPHDDRVDPMCDGIEQLLGKRLSSFDVLMDNQE